MSSPESTRSFRDLAEQEIQGLNLPESSENEQLIKQLKIHERELELQHEALIAIQSELEQRNRQFTQLFEAAPIPYVLLDPGGTILLANQPAQQLLAHPGSAYRPKQTITSESLLSFIQDGDRTSVKKHLEQVMESGKGRIEELLIPGADSSGRWCSIESSREPDEMRWIFMIFFDISAKKAMEDDLILAQNQAVQANKLKNLFLANLTHELRGALTSILHLAQEADPEAAAQYEGPLPALQRTAQGTLRLIDDILDYTATEDGTLSIRNRSFRFVDLIDHLRERYTPQARGKGLELHCRSQIPEDLLFESDQDRLSQILSNLIHNAITYTDTGRIDIIASYKPLTDFMGELDVEVRDTGIGIPQQIIRDIWQGPSTDGNQFKKKTKGPGLGLPLSKRITKLLGGQIYINSNPGFGTSAYLNLPVHVKKAPPVIKTTLQDSGASLDHLQLSHSDRIQQHSQSGTGSSGTSTGAYTGSQEKKQLPTHLHVLVAEDNDLNRIVLVNILKGMGFSRISSARDGKEVIDILHQSPDVGLIMMDISMPGMDGLQAARIIRSGKAGNPEVPIIAVSAHSLRGDNKTAATAGLNHHIIKPYTRLHVQQALEKVLL
jgi:signal transduction histidine kinase/CheY-like chemotaxis protein